MEVEEVKRGWKTGRARGNGKGVGLETAGASYSAALKLPSDEVNVV